MIYKCTIQYDGSKFSGWQKQPGEFTVQQSIEEALSIIHKEPMRIHGSGRTDKGVHAFAQVFHFESDLNMDGKAFHRALNALIPKSCHILSVEAKADFHARFDASSKSYEYKINPNEYNVFMSDYEYQYGKTLDVEAMESAAKIFVGTHDFTSFNATELEVIPNQVRTIDHIFILEDESQLRIFIQGDGFLRYMVRMMVAALIEVGSHRMTKDQIQSILEAKDKTAFTKNVPSCGLYLTHVDYDLRD